MSLARSGQRHPAGDTWLLLVATLLSVGIVSMHFLTGAPTSLTSWMSHDSASHSAEAAGGQHVEPGSGQLSAPSVSAAVPDGAPSHPAHHLIGMCLALVAACCALVLALRGRSQRWILRRPPSILAAVRSLRATSLVPPAPDLIHLSVARC
jgi:hypothetical protein